MDLQRLREATAAEHAATEDAVPLMRPDLARADYVGSLRRFYRVVSAWDRWTDAHTPADLQPLLEGRRRATLLQRDLEAMHSAIPADELAAEAMERTFIEGDPRSIFLGRMYVMEGSTLGGQFLARHAEETLGLAEGEGTAYFRGYGDATGERWREVRAVLGALPDSETGTVVAAAKEMFTIFREAMRTDAPPAGGNQSVNVAGPIGTAERLA